MYSKIIVDVSCKDGEFDEYKISPPNTSRRYDIAYKVLPIIRGSSTVNGDSAHDHTALGMEHNYVTFNVKKIKLSCSFLCNTITSNLNRLSYIVLFKIPYIDEDHLPKLASSGLLGSINNFILYKNPEDVLTYGCLNLTTNKKHTDYTLYCNKSFNVGPNDYLGVCYFLNETDGNSYANVDASAEVTFKPI